MPAKILQCSKSKTHPNADTLRVYNFTDGTDNFTIVANSTNIYEVGDKAAVALIGSVLKDDTEIKQSKIRGIISEGMALGKSELPVGLDVTDDFCHSETLKLTGENPILVRWPSITSLYDVRKNISEADSIRKIKYRAKIKLDGSNGGISIYPNGDVVTQSREQIITPEKDNAGFARWVDSNKDFFSALKQDTQICIFGEWAGKGIAKTCAITKIDRKVFCVFAIQYFTKQGALLEINPIIIKDTLEKFGTNPDLFVIPFYGPVLTLNYFDTEDLKIHVETINQMVFDVEKCDPYVFAQFGVEGIGEGVVMFPLPSDANEIESMLIPRLEFSDLGFKAKGQEHKVVKTKTPVQIDPEVANSISEFVNLFCTENRLNQIAAKIGEFNLRNTGVFLKDFCQDVCKESKSELEVSNLTWDGVSNSVSGYARKWWIGECNKL